MPDEDEPQGLEGGLRAAYGRPGCEPSVLKRLEERGVPAPRVLLREAPADPAPVLRPTTGVDGGGRYQVAGELARGGVGIIYRGRDVDLGRDVAMKVLLEHHARNDDLVRRFVEEAQIGGQLQHPGIVPVYELGLQPDGRPFFAMKLVKGKTLSALLAARSDPARDRRRFLSIFESVCQTVAYAHARGVIHRDLKPSNVMVGAFGEVQVVDWGFAKVLGQGGVADEERALRKPEVSVIATVRSGSGSAPSLAGSVMGTPAYMPPEQALGEVERMDERSDVFSLGAILCEILTGRPPYHGAANLLVEAAGARLEDAYHRLDLCGADGALRKIAKRCLVAAVDSRFRDAAELARAMGAYFAALDERVRKARLAVAEAHAKAEEAGRRVLVERRARRLTLGLAAAVLLAVLATGAGLVWVSEERAARREQAAIPVRRALEEANLLRGEARGDPARWPEVIALAERALDLAGDDGGRARTREFLEAVRSERGAAERAAAAAARDRAMVVRLRELRLRRGDHFDAAARNAAIESALGDYGIDLDVPAEAAAAIRASAISGDLVAALDDRAGLSDRFLGLRQAADPDPFRTHLRSLASQENRERLASLDVAEDLPLASVLLAADTMGRAGSAEECVDLLRIAQRRHPRDFWVNVMLGWWLMHLPERRWEEAARFLSVALSLEQDSIGTRYHLALALDNNGDLAAAVDAWTAVWRADPGHGEARDLLGEALERKGIAFRGAGASESAAGALREAVAVRPESAAAHNLLGLALFDLEDWEGSEASLREALRLRPEDPLYQGNLGIALNRLGQYDKAIKVLRDAQATVRASGGPVGFETVLASALYRNGNLDEAEAELRATLEWNRNALVYAMLANVQCRKGNLAAAAETHRECLARGEWLGARAPRIWNDLVLTLRATEGHEAAERAAQEAESWFRDRVDGNSMAGYHLLYLARWLADAPEPRWRRTEEALALLPRIRAAFGGDALRGNTGPILWVDGLVRYRSGDYEGAREALSGVRLSKGDPDWAAAVMLLSMSHARLGNEAEARRLFDKARDWMARYPENVDLDLERLRDEATSVLR